MLRYRILTALVLAPLVIWAILSMPTLWFAGVVAAMMVLAAWEWSQLVPLKRPLMRFLYAELILVLILLVYWLPAMPVFILGSIVWVWAIAAVLCFASRGNLLGFQHPWVRFVAGAIILPVAWEAIVILRAETSVGAMWLLGLFLVVWSVDIGAYFSGRLWGKEKLAPSISPKKTWAGLFGGVGLAFAVALIVSWCLPFSVAQQITFIGMMLFVALISVVGDLFESLLKRQVNIKDSGNILPGHGGILDRIDSILAAVTLFALVSHLVGF